MRKIIFLKKHKSKIETILLIIAIYVIIILGRASRKASIRQIEELLHSFHNGELTQKSITVPEKINI